MPGEAEGGPEPFRAALVSCHRQLRETRDQREPVERRRRHGSGDSGATRAPSVILWADREGRRGNGVNS